MHNHSFKFGILQLAPGLARVVASFWTAWKPARTLGYGYHEDRTPTHGYEATREAAMAAFAKSWRREES
jgi:hypothetical protein